MTIENSETYDFPNHTQGSTFKGVSFEIIINDIPLDLTDATIIMTLDTFNNSKSNVLILSTELENEKIVILDPPTSGKFRIIPQLINIAGGLYKYDIKIITGDSIVRIPIKGKWYISTVPSYE